MVNLVVVIDNELLGERHRGGAACSSDGRVLLGGGSLGCRTAEEEEHLGGSVSERTGGEGKP
jgi:hypothetical protein